MVGSSSDTRWPDEHYIYVEWGPGFYAMHRESYPDLERPPQVVNIGWLGIQLIMAYGSFCFLPIRVARPLIQGGRLFQVVGASEFPLPAYILFLRRADSDVLQLAVEGLREQAAGEKAED